MGFPGTDEGQAFGLNPQPMQEKYGPQLTRGPIYPVFMSLVTGFGAMKMIWAFWRHGIATGIKCASCRE